MMDSSKIGNGLPVIGQGPDIGVSSLPMVGYLGKNYDSAKVTSDGYCPACREKGKLKALKTYRISFQESIFLCEDLQCIYPLGSKSLNNLISPDSEDCHTPNKPQKRKVLETSCKDLSILANSKKTKTHIFTDDKQILNSEHNGEVCNETSSNSLRGSRQHNSVRTAESLGQNKTSEAGDVGEATQDPATVDTSGIGGISSQNEGCTSEFETPWERTRSFCQTSCIQWRNANALCWLDAILSALVHLEALRNTVTEVCSKDSVFWRLFEKYNQANKLLRTSQLDEIKDADCKKLTSEIFAEIETCLNEVRDEVFTKLQPQLRCTLGERESPVFAFPLLLRIEAHIEKLFTYSFSWDFECSQCGHRYQNRCVKNLVTFTNIIPEWHPLNAAHFGPCNSCNNKSQIRKMVLEKVSPIFMLHFVEGLPRNDLQHYAFHFEGCLYQVTSVIQYQANDHFITWILHADGNWLECDDLKGLCAQRHEKFEVAASEIHIVIWERKTSQATDEEAVCLPLKKTNDQPASGEERPASPALRSVGQAASAELSSVTLPTSLSLTPHTLPQDKAVAHEEYILSDPKVLVDNNILPLTLEGSIWKTASVLQVSTEASLSENTPVAENTELVKTNTLQLQESPVDSSVSSAPCKEKLTQAQFVGLSFPLQVVSTNTQLILLNTEDTAVTQPVNNAHATGLVQGVKSVEVEKDTQLKQSLSWKTEKLKPESPSVSRVSNLKKNATADPQTVTAKSSQNQPPKENQKKPFVGSWVKGLLSRGASFMPSCVSAHNRNTVTDLQPSVKGASNFGGFKTKGTKQKANHTSKKARRSADKLPAVSSRPPGLPLSENIAAAPHTSENAASELPKEQGSISHGAHLCHSSHGRESEVSSADQRDSAEGQIHKLRLKLLKKLKAKKKKLAALMASPQSGTLPSENLEHGPHCESPNDCESIEDLLNELQYQIDIADNKSGCTPVSGVSSYNNPIHEEILAELLSPSISAEFPETGEADFRYLEMGDNHVPAPEPAELTNNSQNVHLKQEHNYCSPTKRNQCDVQAVSQVNSACVRALNLESPMKTDIFDEFFPTALTSSANDTLDLPHFDEYLFENC
ncbi:SUMO-specific isopeptidase USPL1 isoform 3-T3 [Erethizon dorsatum]